MKLPPRICERLLERTVPLEHREAILGDLAEEYVSRSATNWWYYKEAFMVLLHTRGIRVLAFLGLNVAAFAIFWVLLFASGHLFERPLAHILEPTLTAAAVLIALRLGAKPMAFFLASMLAFSLAEYIAHTVWGSHVVRGAQTHFTVMGAGLFGVIFGALLVRYVAGRASEAKATA